MRTQWLPRVLSGEQKALVQVLEQELGLDALVARVLVSRGIATLEDAMRFLKPSLADLHDPYLMVDMATAVERLVTAVERGEHILLYGDYDVDGTTAVALLYGFLRDHACPEELLHYYIPDRQDDGYGLTYRGVDEALSLGVSLIVALDCGIKAVGEVAYAHEMGVECIICDHHLPESTLPNALAILNPKLSRESYPFEHLSGCGIGYKLVQAYCLRRALSPEVPLVYLELVAMSILADLVPVVGENRVLVHEGLKRINTNPSVVVEELIRSTALQGHYIDASLVVYKMTPLLNASGRMMSGRETVEFLLSKTREEARDRLVRIEEYNALRKQHDQLVTREALELIDADLSHVRQPILIVYHPDWHQGVLGIVASRLATRYARPAVVLCRVGDLIVGSARAVGEVDIPRALDACSDLLENYGGHLLAAGVSMRLEKLEEFTQRMQGYFSSMSIPLGSESVVRSAYYDAELSLEEINSSRALLLESLEPWGVGNEEPIFVTRGIRDAGGTRRVGRERQHLRLRMVDRYCRQKPVSAIALGQAESAARRVLSQQLFDCYYTLSYPCYRGSRSLQVLVKDIVEHL